MSTDLHLAAIYRRRVRASLERVWENVFDWEHFPSLHYGSFSECALVETHAKGWTVRLSSRTGRGARTSTVRLEADRVQNHYVVRTIEGPGEGSEVRTQLSIIGRDETDVNVGFFVLESEEEKLKAIGETYLDLYARLWDEDEEMMRRRESQLRLARAKHTPATEPLELGVIEDVKARLPFVVGFGGEMWRIIALGDDIIAHATVCPHWLGPLDQVNVVEGRIRCPWHGYAFDVRTGANLDGKCGRLSEAPRVVVDQQANMVSLEPRETALPSNVIPISPKAIIPGISDAQPRD